MTETITDTKKTKHEMRAQALGRRHKASVDGGFAEQCANTVVQFASGLMTSQDVGVVAGYWPHKSEIDIREIYPILRERGWQIALPVMQGENMPLDFRLWDGVSELVQGPHGIFEPTWDNDKVVPDVVLAPLAAFDRTGFRMGYGGGYYDRTFDKMRQDGNHPLFVGCAYSVQEIDSAPAEPHDEPLDLIVTEKEILNFLELRKIS
jgi:5-formyltetrahydrofolate cyclo-ligase